MFLICANEHKNFVFDTTSRIGRQRGAVPGLVGIYGFDQPDTAHGNQVVRLRRSRIFFDYMRHQTHIVLNQNILRFLIALSGQSEILFFLLFGQRLRKRIFSADGPREKYNFTDNRP